MKFVKLPQLTVFQMDLNVSRKIYVSIIKINIPVNLVAKMVIVHGLVLPVN